MRKSSNSNLDEYKRELEQIINGNNELQKIIKQLDNEDYKVNTNRNS